jgi:tetratricopeptide (TPR) repeat protein
VLQDRVRLAELAGQREVWIAKVPFAVLLVAHHAAGTTGTLRARRGPVDKRVVLERGHPVDCRSNLVHETLSRYLAAIGRLSEETAIACLSKATAKGVRVGEVLIADGLLDAAELTRILQQNLAKKLLDLFTWPDGEVTVEVGPGRGDSTLKVKVPQLVLTGITRFMPQAAVERAIHPFGGLLLARHPNAGGLASELRLASREQSVLAALGRPARMEELMSAVGIGAEELSRSLLALLVLELVVQADRLRELEREPTAAAPPPPAPLPDRVPATEAAPTPQAPEPARPGPAVAATAAADAPAPLDEQQRSDALNRVSQLYLDHRQKDAFDLLGIEDDATEADIDRAYIDFAREFSPWRFEAPGLRLVADYARELFLAGAHAYGLLVDAEKRSELRIRRSIRREDAARAARAAYHRIETDLLDPALQFRKGMALKEGGKLRAALQQLEFAADCDPQNGTYRAEAAHCRFLLSPGSEGKTALEELREAQRVDPKSVEALMYHAEIAAQLGLFEEAEASLRRAARLLGPDDRRALDALRTLAAARKKKR